MLVLNPVIFLRSRYLFFVLWFLFCTSRNIKWASSCFIYHIQTLIIIPDWDKIPSMSASFRFQKFKFSCIKVQEVYNHRRFISVLLSLSLTCRCQLSAHAGVFYVSSKNVCTIILHQVLERHPNLELHIKIYRSVPQ